MNEGTRRKLFVVVLQLLLAILLVAARGWMSGTLRVFYQSYFADLLIPFSFYFLLTLLADQQKQLGKWWVRALLVFALCALSETLQYFGVYALATVFDPLDYVMYGVGVLTAVLVDRLLFTRLLPFWE